VWRLQNNAWPLNNEHGLMYVMYALGNEKNMMQPDCNKKYYTKCVLCLNTCSVLCNLSAINC